MHPNCRRGSLPNIRGSRLSAVPFCISILTSVRRIIKIAVRFLHTKTALCDRKDTQSRFAVNAARSIVCVETKAGSSSHRVCDCGFNAARSIVCVETQVRKLFRLGGTKFQCRTQHCVCRDTFNDQTVRLYASFQCRTQHCVCRDIRTWTALSTFFGVSMPHAALCVSRQHTASAQASQRGVSMPHAALCVSRQRLGHGVW